MYKITSHILKALRTEWSSIHLTCSILHIYLSTWIQLHRYITDGHVSSCFMLCILCGVLVFSHLSLHLLSLTKCPFHLPENYYYHSRFMRNILFLSPFDPKTPILLLVICCVPYYPKYILRKEHIAFFCIFSSLSPIRLKSLRASTVSQYCYTPAIVIYRLHKSL